jgi:hypothetical protein
VTRTMSSVKFLFMAPFILGFLFLINLMTWQGEWWVQWAALGLGIAWVSSLFRVIRAVIVGGGLAAVAAYWLKNRGSRSPFN